LKSEGLEPGAVEPRQSSKCAYPQVAVASLSNGGDCILWQAIIPRPGINSIGERLSDLTYRGRGKQQRTQRNHRPQHRSSILSNWNKTTITILANATRFCKLDGGTA
jgi:hypothetical protein